MTGSIVFLLVALAAGAGYLLGALLAGRRSAAAPTAALESIQESRVRAERAEAEAVFARAAAEDAARAHLLELDRLRGSFEDRLSDERSLSEKRLAEARDGAKAQLEHERATARAEVERERTAALGRLEELRADQKRLAEQFDSLSRQALAANAEVFLQQAEERFKRAQTENVAELAKREQAVAQLVEPLNKALAEVKNHVSTAETSRAEAHGALAEQVRAMQESSRLLRDETSQLVTALRAPQVRGRWGELQLRRIVEAAGMLEHVDFEEQATVSAGDSVLRPDLVVKLPGDKQVVVDSKVAFSAYLEAMEARDDATRTKRLEAHARHLRNHVDSLSSKAYWEHVSGTPEFVVMFVPAEVFLNAALEQDPGLLEHAFGRNVVIATPATLVALLRTVGYTWRQEMLAAEAQQVFTVGRELHKRLGVLGSHLANLGKRLNSTVEAFNLMNSSLDRNVVTQARRLSALQGLEPNLEAAPPLEILAVAAQKPDLYAEAEVPAGIGPAAVGDRGQVIAAVAGRGASADAAERAIESLVAAELARAGAKTPQPARTGTTG